MILILILISALFLFFIAESIKNKVEVEAEVEVEVEVEVNRQQTLGYHDVSSHIQKVIIDSFCKHIAEGVKGSTVSNSAGTVRNSTGTVRNSTGTVRNIRGSKDIARFERQLNDANSNVSRNDMAQVKESEYWLEILLIFIFKLAFIIFYSIR